jgi:hypothetical protein
MTPSRVLNICAAEGHYAVGLAMRVPGAYVVAFEAQTNQHALLAEIAERNGVLDRIEIRGTCDMASLQEGLAPGTLVVCDCDGGERELLDPRTAPQLTSCTLLVETHDLLVEGVTETLRERFAATHDISEIPTRPRYVDDFPELGDIPLVTRQLAISEFRGAPMAWLAMRPLTA